VCDGEIPSRATGRPAFFCSVVCRKRADHRRSQAARLLEYAHVVEHGRDTGIVDEEMARRRAASRIRQVEGLRAKAVALLERIGPGEPA
jgi:hypothetical protein